MKTWYAVIRDRDDNDWGYGSHSLEDAKNMLKNMEEDNAYIAVIENDLCVKELSQNDLFKARKIKDGWHKVYGHDVYVEDCKVLRGTTADGQNTTYPYRWNGNCFVNVSGIGFDSFRSGMRRNTIEMK